MAFLRELFAQVFSDGARIEARRYVAYDGLLGALVLAGAVVLWGSGAAVPLGGLGFGVVFGAGLVLAAPWVVGRARPGVVAPLLAAHGAVVAALALGLGWACGSWALAPRAEGSFRYLPGLLLVGMTYGGALWADFGPWRGRPRPWRLAGFVAGLALEGVVAVLVIRALIGR